MLIIKTVLLALGLLLLAVAGMGIKVLLKKNGTFQAKSCSSNSSKRGCNCSCN